MRNDGIGRQHLFHLHPSAFQQWLQIQIADQTAQIVRMRVAQPGGFDVTAAGLLAGAGVRKTNCSDSRTIRSDSVTAVADNGRRSSSAEAPKNNPSTGK